MAVRLRQFFIRKSTFKYLSCLTLLFLLTIQVPPFKNIYEYVRNVLLAFDATDQLVLFFNQAPILRERLLLIDKNVLQQYQDMRSSQIPACFFCKIARYEPITFGLITPANHSLEEHVMLPILRAWEVGFWVEQFVFSKLSKFSPHRLNLPLGFILQKGGGAVIIEVVLLHQREGDFWWHGALHEDVGYAQKLANLKISDGQQSLALDNEGSYDKVRFEMVTLDGLDLNIPLDVPNFLKSASTFVECNYERADKFHRLYGRDVSSRARLFRHRVRKLLTITKTILDQLKIRFWISSGTCLGYFRQCDVIPYSQDVDIGIFIKEYDESIITAFKSRGLKLKHKFGRENDGLEISFNMRGIKLDIFFFYEEVDHFWNGGHSLIYQGGQLHSGIKYRYKFPKFSLCWTEFLEMKVRIPCETEAYITANYGPNWFQPKPKWHWYKDPYNVVKSGEWAPEEVSEVLQIFQ